jgi:hypothetical protein
VGGKAHRFVVAAAAADRAVHSAAVPLSERTPDLGILRRPRPARGKSAPVRSRIVRLSVREHRCFMTAISEPGRLTRSRGGTVVVRASEDSYTGSTPTSRVPRL